MHIMDHGDIEYDTATDVLIIGGGGGGLVAAATASAYDVTVTVLEKERRVGGNTILSEGIVLGADSAAQRREGIDDSAKLLVSDLLSIPGYTNEPLLKALAAESGPTIDWLTDEIGVEFRLDKRMRPLQGNSVHRAHYTARGEMLLTGEPLIEGLATAAQGNGAEVQTDSPVKRLLFEDNAVVGAVTRGRQQPDGSTEKRVIGAENVLLATNGFGANRDMLESYFDDLPEVPYWGASGNTGDEIKWGRKLNVRIRNVSYSVSPMRTFPKEFYLPERLVREGAVMVNRKGERFGDVGAFAPPDFSARVLTQPGGIAYLIFDREIYDQMTTSSFTKHRFAVAIEQEIFETANDIDELGRTFEIDAETLTRTIERTNRAAQGEHLDTHPRTSDNVLRPPFYGVKIKPCVSETRGGLEVNERTEVVRRNGSPIPNLFAAGGASEGILESNVQGYIPGTQLFVVLNTGRIMGRMAAERVV